MVSNGHMNGRAGRANSEDLSTVSLKQLEDELCNELSSLRKPITIRSGESGDAYVRNAYRLLASFLQRVGEEVTEREKRIAHKVNGPQQEAAHALVNEIKQTMAQINVLGKQFNTSSEIFVADLFSSSKRNTAVRDAGNELTEIMKLFLLIDRLDVMFVLGSIDVAGTLLTNLRNARTIEEVEERYSMLLSVLEEIDESMSIRMAEVRSSLERDDLIAARSLLKSCCPLVHSTCKAVINHPEYSEVCDDAHAEMRRALDMAHKALSGQHSAHSSSLLQYGRLAAELENFQGRFMMDPSQYRGSKDRAELEEMLERIVTGSASIADEPSTRSERKHKIISECNNLRQALQDLLKEYETNRGKAEASEDVDLAMVLVGRRMKDLKRHLRRAIVDNVGDAFLDQSTPLLALIHAAYTGDAARTKEAADGRGGFVEHAKRLIQVARLATEMSTDQEGMRCIKFAIEDLERFIPQVVEGAYLLCQNPQSEVAREHMEVLRKLWQHKVHGLTLGVDALLSLDDFIAVSESHIVEDATAGVQAVHEKNALQLDSCAGAIRGRALRVCCVVEEEMDTLDMAGPFVETVKQASTVLREEVAKFSANSEELISRLETTEEMSGQEKAQNADEFAASCNLVLDSVKKIRNALLVNRNPEDVDSDNEYEDDGMTHADQKSTVSDVENQQRLMRKLPEEDKRKIQAQIDVFKITQSKFEREVAKWDETGNDIIVLAKHMCMIMMNMTDFTRGRGPLKSTMDVIKAAQEISTAGQKLSVLARQIGDEAEENNAGNEKLRRTKADLVSYLEKMVLFCQQLNICSRVKADVQQVGEELVVSGLDSAMSLIQTARNLLSAVVSTVKNAYIISTKFRTDTSASRVEWKMTRPKKQPLVAPSGGGRSHGIVRRASEKRAMPMHALSEFTR